MTTGRVLGVTPSEWGGPHVLVVTDEGAREWHEIAFSEVDDALERGECVANLMKPVRCPELTAAQDLF